LFISTALIFNSHPPTEVLWIKYFHRTDGGWLIYTWDTMSQERCETSSVSLWLIIFYIRESKRTVLQGTSCSQVALMLHLLHVGTIACRIPQD
jgi:hypothetical protein